MTDMTRARIHAVRLSNNQIITISELRDQLLIGWAGSDAQLVNNSVNDNDIHTVVCSINSRGDVSVMSNCIEGVIALASGLSKQTIAERIAQDYPFAFAINPFGTGDWHKVDADSPLGRRLFGFYEVAKPTLYGNSDAVDLLVQLMNNIVYATTPAAPIQPPRQVDLQPEKTYSGEDAPL